MPDSIKTPKNLLSKAKMILNTFFAGVSLILTLIGITVIHNKSYLNNNLFLYVLFFCSIFLMSFLFLIGYSNKSSYQFYWYITGIFYTILLIFLLFMKQEEFSDTRRISFLLNLRELGINALAFCPIIPILRGIGWCNG